MQDSFLLGLAGEGSHDSPEDTELMVTLVWVCGYLCGGKEGFMHLRRFIGVPPPSSSGSPEMHRKRRILKSHLVPQTAAIYHHCSPYSVHKDSAVPLWATHFNVCVCVCVTVHIKMLAYHWLLSWLWYLVKEGEGCCELYLACWYQKKFKRTERHRLLSEHQCTIVTYRHKRLKLKQNFFLFYFYLKTEITINLIISESKTQVKLVDHLEKIIRMKRWNICRLKYFN